MMIRRQTVTQVERLDEIKMPPRKDDCQEKVGTPTHRGIASLKPIKKALRYPF